MIAAIEWMRSKWYAGAETRRIVEASRREVKRLKAADKAERRAEKLRGIV